MPLDPPRKDGTKPVAPRPAPRAEPGAKRPPGKVVPQKQGAAPPAPAKPFPSKPFPPKPLAPKPAAPRRPDPAPPAAALRPPLAAPPAGALVAPSESRTPAAAPAGRIRSARFDLRHHPVVEAARALSRSLGLWAVGHF